MNRKVIQNIAFYLGILTLPVLPYILFLAEHKKNNYDFINPMYAAGRAVYENSGCRSCHSRFLNLYPEEIIRAFPGNYYAINPKAISSRFLNSRIDLTQSRVGPDLEHIDFLMFDEDYIAGYIKNPRKYYHHSLMPSYYKLFQENLRGNEIFFASQNHKINIGYITYSRGQALMFYLKLSSAGFGG